MASHRLEPKCAVWPCAILDSALVGKECRLTKSWAMENPNTQFLSLGLTSFGTFSFKNIKTIYFKLKSQRPSEDWKNSNMCQYLITTDNDNDESKDNDRKHLKKSGHKVTRIQTSARQQCQPNCFHSWTWKASHLLHSNNSKICLNLVLMSSKRTPNNFCDCLSNVLY